MAKQSYEDFLTVERLRTMLVALNKQYMDGLAHLNYLNSVDNKYLGEILWVEKVNRRTQELAYFINEKLQRKLKNIKQNEQRRNRPNKAND